jgi:hypothetical protein
MSGREKSGSAQNNTDLNCHMILDKSKIEVFKNEYKKILPPFS